MKKQLFLFMFLVGCASGSHHPSTAPLDTSNKNVAKYPPFAAEVNDRVMGEVKTFTQTPASRESFKAALARMKRFKSKTAPAFEKASLPPELLALPIVITNYENLRSTEKEGGIGIWKFTPYMATTYGLVTAKKDHRLMIAKETEAATAYLTHLFNLFHDWRFVLIAYCEGEGWLTAAIEKHPSSSPWEIDLTITNTQSCLAQTMAALYLIGHPELLK